VDLNGVGLAFAIILANICFRKFLGDHDVSIHIVLKLIYIVLKLILLGPSFLYAYLRLTIWCSCPVVNQRYFISFSFSSHHHTIQERIICKGLSLFHNRLILTPFYMSLTSSDILLSLIDNRSIYTSCHMSLPLYEILQQLPLHHVSIIVQVLAITLQILFRDLVATCMHAGASSSWTLARWQPAVNQFYLLQSSNSST
jgi:hypothetical protein